MKTLFISFFFAFALVSSTVAQSQFTVDAKASQLNWTGYAELGSWAPSGTIQVSKGQFSVAGRQITTGRISIDMTTLQHEDAKLQAHLRDEDFFDIARYPTATFLLASLSGQVATGQLTIRGVTRPVTFPVVVSPEGDGLRIKGKAVIDRTQFAIRYNSTSFFSGLGDYAIKNEFSLAFNIVVKPAGKPGIAGRPAESSRR
ncbi:YceI family protein [Spirosoma fluviale]|uniref:Polyisoprenoid-binding protein YceI n=1 Tax=Spirosoma fluviale TaxID=1597977 RepID=A0A286G9F6_9BACT|nr:YceI family protein [Spirosoma fluviale]SOD92102.1 Polyisoprenoid-binding protein YceI [Spirosoma fluviale]